MIEREREREQKVVMKKNIRLGIDKSLYPESQNLHR